MQQAGFSVMSAKSSEEAQEKLNSNRPDLIFLDVILPGKSGYEICRELKTNPTTSGIPIVFCSTKNSDVDKMWGTMLGADAYISKPIDKQELEGAIRLLIK
ncbi:response regulator transcription factor [Brunnivagina elsteri]|uniref:Two-component system response regulator n=1 Tax=Brunnivagina elsteri CCALA 953 TaxID=987040 RepID=A0A2A2TBB1_9CYAN|nr:response regulator [Calothrix elsteri]PAX51020.1 two-component system response regulator [Calothrix elsteri CCALA 953]